MLVNGVTMVSMLEVKDIQLTCAKCGNPFTFTAREAQSFNEKGLTNVPKKCPACRAKDRVKKEQKVRVMVSCATCGTDLEVPFEPVRDANGQPLRPLYCLEHFEQATATS